MRWRKRAWRTPGQNRSEIRKAFPGTVEVIGPWDEPLPFPVRDLSADGVFVVSDCLLALGEEVVVSMRVPGFRREITVFGEVARVCCPRRRTDRGHPGMGIAFLDAAPLERLALRESLRTVPPPLPLP